MSRADEIFKSNVELMLSEGYDNTGELVRPVWLDGTPAYTTAVFGVVNRYDLSKEFPILNLRRVPFKSALDEILWIYRDNSNDVRDLSSRVWDAWAGDDHTIGKAYGYQIGKITSYPEGDFNQIDKVIYDLRNNPNSRSIIMNMYNIEELSEMGLRPCAYSLTFNVKDGKLNAILNQRSQDFITANAWNVTQYATLIYMIAHVTNLEVGEFIHVIADCHIYDRHIPIAEELLTKTDGIAPKIWLNPEVKEFQDFLIDDIKLIDYKPNPGKYNIEVAE